MSLSLTLTVSVAAWPREPSINQCHLNTTLTLTLTLTLTITLTQTLIGRRSSLSTPPLEWEP